MLQEERSVGRESKEDSSSTDWSDTDEELQALIERIEQISMKEKQNKYKRKRAKEKEGRPQNHASSPGAIRTTSEHAPNSGAICATTL